MLAKEIMTTDVITVTEDTNINDVSKIFVEKNISGVPVVDAEGRAVGVISECDVVYKQKPVRPPLFIHLLDGLIPIDRKDFLEDMKRIAAYKVGDLMSKPAICAHVDTPVSELAELMIDKKINRIPIVDDQKKVVGVVSRHDIVRSMVTE